MWAEACRTLERAERLQHRFFEPGQQPRAGTGWEPPVDVFETGRNLWIVVALPGVAVVNVEFDGERNSLLVSGERRLPRQVRHASIHRLELPHGRFSRRISLPSRPWRMVHRDLTDGCLVLNFRYQDLEEGTEK